VVGADSHSTTYGALGCFAAGFGSTDIAVTFATGRTWFRVPETIRINLRGALPPGIFPKDLALQVIRRLGAEGANYLAVEWGGDPTRRSLRGQLRQRPDRGPGDRRGLFRGAPGASPHPDDRGAGLEADLHGGARPRLHPDLHGGGRAGNERRLRTVPRPPARG